MEKKKLIALFPGICYSVDMPLLYYAGLKYRALGYKEWNIDYGNNCGPYSTVEECIDDVKKYVLQQATYMDFSVYDEILFVSKSLGTAVAGWLAEELELTVRHIFLTPVKETLPYIKGENIIAVVAGTQDNHLDASVLKEHCNKEGVYLKQFKGVGHRLEIPENVSSSIDIIKQISDLYV